jgi:hypothetical protein
MTTKTIQQILNTLFSDLSDSLVYHNTSPASDKAMILQSRDLVRDALTLLESEPQTGAPQDFTVRLLDGTVIYHMIGARPTTSKILAIKIVRARTNKGLKDCKDYVDNIVPISVQDNLTLDPWK